MRSEKRLDDLNAVIEELSELPDDHTIVVEGINDRKALNSLGILKDIVMVQSEGGPLKISERLHSGGRKAVILTDWDRKGENIASELKRNLYSLCVPFDLSIRSRLKDLSVKDIKDVESLPSLRDRLIAESGRSP